MCLFMRQTLIAFLDWRGTFEDRDVETVAGQQWVNRCLGDLAATLIGHVVGTPPGTWKKAPPVKRCSRFTNCLLISAFDYCPNAPISRATARKHP